MSPILVRPVREQLEHDRVIRLLQARFKRKHEVTINVGEERVAPVKGANGAFYPDLVLSDAQRGRKLEGVVEVETGESVNHLEAMSEWATFGRARVPFYLYVPAGSVDVARRLCQDIQVTPTELWTYHGVGDQVRFTLIQRTVPPPERRPARRAQGRVTAKAAQASSARKARSVGQPVAASRRASSRKSANRTARRKAATPSAAGAKRSARSGAASRGGASARRKPARPASAARSKTGRR